MVKIIYTVCSYHYIESGSFYIEKSFIGENAEEQAIKLAFNMNKHHIKYGEYYCRKNYTINCSCEMDDEDNNLTLDEGYTILSDTSKTEKERLRDYINYLDYSNGN
jgi:hypothetical protein